LTPLEMVELMIAISDNVKTLMSQVEAEQYYADQEYNDLTHALELTRFNAAEGFRLAKELQDNRLRRRNAKNQREQLQPLYDLIQKYQVFFKELKNVQAQIESVIHAQAKRKYQPRVRDDLFRKVEVT